VAFRVSPPGARNLSNVPSLLGFLKMIFLGKSKKWDDGNKIRPVDQKLTSFVREEFSKKVLGKSVTAVKNYWHQQIFSGRGVPPPEKNSDRAVISYV